MCPHRYRVTPNKQEIDPGGKLSRDISNCACGKASNPMLFDEILALSAQKKSGLILCKRYHAEFVGPGASIGTPQTEGYKAIITICSPDLVKVNSYQERQQAYKIRIQWMRWQTQIINRSKDPFVRIERLLSCFEEFFGREAIAQLPNDVLGLLIGVLPQTIERFRQQNHLPETGWGNLVSCWKTLYLDALAVREAIALQDIPCQSCLSKHV